MPKLSKNKKQTFKDLESKEKSSEENKKLKKKDYLKNVHKSNNLKMKQLLLNSQMLMVN